MITIKRANASVLIIRPDANSYQGKSIMGENIVFLSFSLANKADILIGDYLDIDDERYFVNQPPILVKKSGKKFEYQATFEAYAYDLTKVKYFFLNDLNNLREIDFTINGNLQTFANLLLQNINRIYSGWSLGIVDDTDVKNLSFSNSNCKEVLQHLADEFKTEFWIEGKTINISVRQEASGIQLEYGKDKGLYELKRGNLDASNVITQLYVYGSSKNIPGNYKNYSNRLKLDDVLEKNIDLYGKSEDAITLDEIYPKRIGFITSVTNELTFTDADIDFNVNDQLLPDIKAKLTFNTGQLAGYEFEINSFNNSTKTFVINTNTNEKAIEVPSSLIHAEVGDAYVLTEMIMPDSYITAAESELTVKGLEYLNKNASPKVTYALSCDPFFFKFNNVNLIIGQTVHVLDADLGVDKDVRIRSFKRYLDKNRYEIDIADKVVVIPYIKLVKQQKALENQQNPPVIPVQPSTPFIPPSLPVIQIYAHVYKWHKPGFGFGDSAGIKTVLRTSSVFGVGLAYYPLCPITFNYEWRNHHGGKDVETINLPELTSSFETTPVDGGFGTPSSIQSMLKPENIVIADCFGSELRINFVFAPDLYMLDAWPVSSLPILTCRTTGNCSDGGVCGVRFKFDITGLDPSKIYTADIAQLPSPDATISVTPVFFTPAGEAYVYLNYLENNDSAGVLYTIRIRQNGFIVAVAGHPTLAGVSHDPLFASIDSCSI